MVFGDCAMKGDAWWWQERYVEMLNQHYLKVYTISWTRRIRYTVKCSCDVFISFFSLIDVCRAERNASLC